jgi:hypothetical protein
LIIDEIAGRIHTGENTGDPWQKMVAIGSIWPCQEEAILQLLTGGVGSSPA